MKIEKDLQVEDIIRIISEASALSAEELKSAIELDAYISGFNIAMKYFRSNKNISEFNNIW